MKEKRTGFSKTVYILLAVAAALLIIFLAPAHEASAKEFEECYHCDGLGKMHCSNCYNRGAVECDGCFGAGGSVCVRCGGDGKETCPSCGGDGITRNEDGELPPEGSEIIPCGNCGGLGYHPCITCHESGRIDCTGCDGSGYSPCRCFPCNENGGDYTCPFCKGTGFCQVGFGMTADWNDGKTNIPKDGELVWYDGNKHTYRYHKTPTGDQAKRIATLLESAKKEALSELEKEYKKYSEKYYTKKEYKKLTKIYNKAVKKINAASDRGVVVDTRYAAKLDMTDLKPSVLRKYIKKLALKMREESCVREIAAERKDPALRYEIEKNTHDELVKLYKAKTKKKAKKIANAYIATLKKSDTL